MTETIPDMSPEDLEHQLLGKRIVEINEDSGECRLDDGTVLAFEDTGECCAWFTASVKRGDLVDSAITGIKVERPTDGAGFAEDDFTIHVLSTDTRVMAVEIEGDSTSGYYCHSVDLRVTKPRKDAE